MRASVEAETFDAARSAAWERPPPWKRIAARDAARLLSAAVALMMKRPSGPASERIVAPVVVNPDIDSKRASMGLSPKSM